MKKYNYISKGSDLKDEKLPVQKVILHLLPVTIVKPFVAVDYCVNTTLTTLHSIFFISTILALGETGFISEH